MGKKQRRRTRKKSSTAESAKSPRLEEVQLDALKSILERVRETLSPEDHAQLESAVDTLAFFTRELEAKGATIARLRKVMFGSRSEKSKDILPKKSDKRDQPGDVRKKKSRRKGRSNGRNPASAYTGAAKKEVPHESLKHKDSCPSCAKGKVYLQQNPETLIRIRGIGPLAATRYELERLRCNACGEPFTAAPPPGVGPQKYDESAVAMIALLRYGCGLPFNRIEKLGDNLGIPMPSSTQWELVDKAAQKLEPLWNALVHRAAHGSVLYIDDTNVKVLELNSALLVALAEGRTKRTGVFTSGIISAIEGRKIALFFTGAKHAGENLAKILAQRSQSLSRPIQMGDASSRNTSGDFDTLVAKCLVHARRNFVDLVESFPDEVEHVVEALREVYKNDRETRERCHSAKERLVFHQEHSRPVMDELEKWLQQQLDERKVEPNSALGGAIGYMQNHWKELTLFLREPGAPLDNNICERGLKKAILHRKNSLFYKTPNGAHVGDVFMSLIHTCELCGLEPFDYLVVTQRNHKAVKAAPADWLPWNYQETLKLKGLTHPSGAGPPDG